jgi:hypothetical protein
MQHDKVREVTSEEENKKIEQDILKNLVFYKYNPAEIPERIEELEKEPDIEKALGTNASILALSGVVFSLFFGKKWLLLPAVVTGFLLQHSLQGWCPPLGIFRKLGFRTRKEIETEKHALKILNGDYDNVSSGENNNPEETLEIVKGDKSIGLETLAATSIKSRRRIRKQEI